MTGHQLSQPDRELSQTDAGGKLALPAEVAEYFRTTTGKLANDRVLGLGPEFVRFNRRILYRWEDVYAFVEANTHQRTDDIPGGKSRPRQAAVSTKAPASSRETSLDRRRADDVNHSAHQRETPTERDTTCPTQ